MKHSLILPALLALAACGQPSPAEKFAAAQAAFANNDFAAARLHVAEALGGQPGDKAMLLLQAKTLIALGEGDGAGAALEKLAGAAPQGELAELAAEAALLRNSPTVALDLLGEAKGAEPERLRALAAIQRGKLDLASEHFSKALAAGGNARTFADFARFKLLSGDVAGAQEMAEKATKAAPQGLDTLLIKGQLAANSGDLATSLSHYERAAALFPASQAALLGQAAVLGDLGRLDDAQKVVGRLMAFAPKQKDVVFLAARLGVARKDWSGVRLAIQPIEGELQPNDPLRALYGEALLRLGQNELAIAQIKPIVSSQPGNRFVVRLLAEAQLATGDAAAAVATLRPVADLPGARPEELALMAKAATAAGDAKASNYAARAKAPAPQMVGSDLAEGDAAMRGGNWARAVTAYDRILSATDGRNVVVLNNMAYAQLMLGNSAKAREFADRALKLAPENPSVLDTAGWVRFKSGTDLKEAGRLLRLAAEKAPGNLTIKSHLDEARRTGVL